jgi:hypothetical protein
MSNEQPDTTHHSCSEEALPTQGHLDERHYPEVQGKRGRGSATKKGAGLPFCCLLLQRQPGALAKMHI